MLWCHLVDSYNRSSWGWGGECFLNARVQTLNIRAEKDLRNHLSTPLILQMGKLRPGEVKDLVKITQLVRGKTGSRTQVFWPPIYFTTLLLKRVQRKGRGNWELWWGLQTLVSVNSSEGKKKVKRVYKLSCLREVSHLHLKF